MSPLRLPAHEATTAQLGAAYPFAAAFPLRVARVLIGSDLTGGVFAYDPFALYEAGVLTNPNMTVLGQIGRGKSALVKSYLCRQAAFGRQVAVLDPKGEYGPLAEALGTVPVRLSPTGGVRVNPLEDLGRHVHAGSGRSPTEAAGSPDGTRHRRLVLLGALAEATLHRRLAPREHLALEIALDAVTTRTAVPTLLHMVDALLRPVPGATTAVGLSDRELEEDGKDIGLELRRLVKGDLAGMFDGETTPSLSAAAGGPTALIVDLSEVYHSEALPALMVCAAAWQAMAGHADRQTLLVIDEAWAVLSDVAVGRFLRSSWKLSRARGTANVAVCHRASDLSASGSAGSEQARLAEGLLADSETVVCYAQPASEIPALATLLGCTEPELEWLPRLRRGVALWRVAGRSFLVEHLLGSHERRLVDTDGRLGSFAASGANGAAGASGSS
jgi:hypothetical protein